MDERPFIGIALGDPTGIGPEIIAPVDFAVLTILSEDLSIKL